MLGTVSDRTLAKQLGMNQATVRRQRHLQGRESFKNSRSAAIGKPEALAQLGKVTDCHLASLRGIDSESVRQKRRSLGIPSSSPSRHRKWTEAEGALMGTASGLEVAAQVGCAVAQAWYARNKREVLAFHPVFPGLMPCYSNLVLCPMRMSLRPRECPFWKARDRNGGYRRSDRSGGLMEILTNWARSQIPRLRSSIASVSLLLQS